MFGKRILEKAGLISPRDVDRLIFEKNYEQALKVIDEQIQENPKDPQLRQKKALILENMERGAEAIKILFRLSDYYVAGEFYSKAVVLLKQIKRIDPQNAKADQRFKEVDERIEAQKSFAEEIRRPDAIEIDEEGAEDLEITDDRWTMEPSRADFDFFRDSPLLAEIPGENRMRFLSRVEWSSYEPGEILITEKEQGSTLLVIASGSVRIYQQDQDHRSKQINIVGAGEFVGEIALTGNFERTATVIAAEPCEILEISRATLLEVSDQNPRIGEIIFEYCRQRFEGDLQRSKSEGA